MNISPVLLSIITTHQCTAACDHCCFSCTPKITKSLPIQVIRDAIHSAKKVPSIVTVVFSGGECFLLDELPELVALATSHGFRTRCVSNGYWATHPETAFNRLKPLATAGLSELTLSTGYFHERFVPAERIIQGAKSALQLGIGVSISIEKVKNKPASVKKLLTDEPQLTLAQKNNRLGIHYGEWITNDGKSELQHSHEQGRFNTDNQSGCSSALKIVSITPDQDVVTCCGLHMEHIPELHLGSLRDESLDTILVKSEDDLLKMQIHVDGPEEVYNFAKSKNPSVELPTQCVHPCETCVALHKDTTALNTLREHAPVVEMDITKKYITSLAMDQLLKKITLQRKKLELR